MSRIACSFVSLPKGLEMSKKVLVVDDEAVVRRYLRRILERNGLEVIEAEDAADAFTEIAKNPDLVITDLEMPKFDGLKLISVIRNPHEADFQGPVILLSGVMSDQVRRQATEFHNVTCMTKPIELANFLATLDEVLP